MLHFFHQALPSVVLTFPIFYVFFKPSSNSIFCLFHINNVISPHELATVMDKKHKNNNVLRFSFLQK